MEVDGRGGGGRCAEAGRLQVDKRRVVARSGP